MTDEENRAFYGEIIKRLRSALSIAQQDFHSNQLQKGDPRHQGQWWMHCPALTCKTLQPIWRQSKRYEPYKRPYRKEVLTQ